MKRLTDSKIITALLIMCVAGFALIGPFVKEFKQGCSLLNTADPYHSLAELEINKFIDRIFHPEYDAEKETNPAPVKKKEKNRKLINLLYILGGMLILNGKILIFSAVMLASVLLKRKSFVQHTRRMRSPPDMRFYLEWILKFITPLEKCVQNRSNEYDIAKLIDLLWEKTRTLRTAVQKVRVFL